MRFAAITGHATLSEVQRYTKAADRKRLAQSAMRKLIEGGSWTLQWLTLVTG
jgi:hypothetical protein